MTMLVKTKSSRGWVRDVFTMRCVKAMTPALCGLLLGTAMTAQQTPVPLASPANFGSASNAAPQRGVQEGIAVDFAIRSSEKSAKIQEGDDVTFRFTVTDTSTGTPVTGARPAAWMDVQRSKQTSSNGCAEKIKEFLSGSVLSRPELDLNAFYVLALNQDATVSVIDPLFGYADSKLLAMVGLKSPGMDWMLSEDESRLFVSMPSAGQVAVIDTVSWKV